MNNQITLRFTYICFTILLSLTMVSQLEAEVKDKVYSKDFLLGRYIPGNQADFSKISSRYSSKDGLYLQTQAYEAFKKMAQAAEKDGIKLIIVSATRNFSDQKSIWEAKWNGSRLVEGQNLNTMVKDPVEKARTILRFSSMPGTSRHHWGTDVDLNNLNNSYFESGKGLKIYQWLLKNAPSFGFYQVYTAKPPREKGYEEEKWHWTYLPLSKEILRQYINSVSLDNINGFTGYDTAFELNMIEDYVKGVNPEVLP